MSRDQRGGPPHLLQPSSGRSLYHLFIIQDIVMMVTKSWNISILYIASKPKSSLWSELGKVKKSKTQKQEGRPTTYQTKSEKNKYDIFRYMWEAFVETFLGRGWSHIKRRPGGALGAIHEGLHPLLRLQTHYFLSTSHVTHSFPINMPIVLLGKLHQYHSWLI